MQSRYKYHTEVDGKQHDSHCERAVIKCAFGIFYDCFD